MSLFKELKRRNVIRVAAAYLVIGWLLAQVSVTLEATLNLPDWFDSMVVSLLLIGFPIALLFSWAFEITPEGIKKEKDIHPDQSIVLHTAKKLDFITLVAAVGVFALIGWQQLNPPTVMQTNQQTADSLEMDSTEAGTTSSKLTNRVIIIEDASIAVLPFVDMSPQGDQSYFSDGVSEELLNLLASIPELRVTSRSSAFSLKDRGLSISEIAERLKVAYVLDGSVRKAGDQLRISAQLINGRSDTQLWSKNFDRTMENIFQIQDEIAGDVVEQIKGTLNIAAPEQRKTDPKAYALFLKARQNRRLGTVQGYIEAIELYRSGLAIDPNYPPAWDELAAVYQSQALTGLRSADEGFRMGREAALEAIRVDPSYAPAYGSLAFIAQYHEADLAVAAENTQKALQLAPNDSAIVGSAGMLLQNLGRVEQGVAAIEYAVASDPLSAPWQYTLGIAYLSAGRYQDAIRTFETTLELSPDFSLGYYHLGVAFMLDGNIARALNEMAKEPREDWRLVAQSMALFALERTQNNDSDESSQADLVLAELLEKYSENMTYNIAYVYAYRGESDATFEWLEKAIQVEDAGVGGILAETLFENITNDSRWLPLLQELGKAPDQLAPLELKYDIPD